MSSFKAVSEMGEVFNFQTRRGSSLTDLKRNRSKRIHPEMAWEQIIALREHT